MNEYNEYIEIGEIEVAAALLVMGHCAALCAPGTYDEHFIFTNKPDTLASLKKIETNKTGIDSRIFDVGVQKLELIVERTGREYPAPALLPICERKFRSNGVN
jgi:hypothetical protein